MNSILQEDSNEALKDIIEEARRAREIVKNLRTLTLGGVYGGVLSVSFQLMVDSFLSSSPANQTPLLILGVVLALVATYIFIDQYRKIYSYGTRSRFFNITFKKDYKKHKEALLSGLQNKFKEKLYIDPINEGGSGDEESVIYIDDPDKSRSTARFTYMPSLKTIGIRIDLEDKNSAGLLNIISNLFGDKNKKQV